MKRIATCLLALALLLSVIGCNQADPPRTPPRRLGDAIEDPARRAAVIEHVQQVWPDVMKQLTNSSDEYGEPKLASELAARAVPGTPTPVWGYCWDLPAGSNPWDGVAQTLNRFDYVIPVLVDGRAVATLESDDYSGSFRVWPTRNYAGMAATATAALGEYFGSGSFEWCYVSNGGMWVVAREGGRTAGVYIDPMMDHRELPLPDGVVADRELITYMKDPVGW